MYSYMQVLFNTSTVQPFFNHSTTPAGYSPPVFLTFILPFTVAAKRQFTITFQGLEFTNSSVLILPIVKANVAALGGRTVVLPLPPAIQAVVAFTVASLSFTSLISGASVLAGAKSVLNLLLKPNTAIRVGSYIQIKLPNFILKKGTVMISDTVGFVDIDMSSWNPLTEELTIILKPQIEIGSSVTLDVTVGGLYTPQVGVSLISNNIFYALGISPLSMPYMLGVSTVQSQFVPINVITEVVAILPSTIVFGIQTNSFNLSQMNITLATSAPFGLGDVIAVNLPVLRALNIVNNGLIIPDGYDTALFSSVNFNQSSKTLTFVMQINHISPLLLNLHALDKYLRFVSSGGSNPALESTIALTRASSSSIAARSIIPTPCIGICVAKISPVEAKAGFPSTYIVDVTFSQPFMVADILSFNLPGFTQTGIPTSPELVTYQQGGVTSSTAFLTAMFYPASQELTISVVNGSSFIATTSLHFTVELENNLALPRTGVPIGTVTDLTWITFSGYPFLTRQIVSISPVGYVNSSSIVFSSRVPGSLVKIDISLKFQGRLEIGDVITILSSGFGGAGVVYVPEGVVGHNFSITGEIGGTSAIPINKLKIKLLTPLNALTILAFSLPARAGFRLPVIGVNQTNVPSIEVQSLVSRIIGDPFKTFTSVGSLSPSSLLITYAPRVTLQQALKVTNISLIFIINCRLIIADKINVIIPNIYGITGPLGVTSNDG
jgi:hypothetical protein